MAKPMKTLELHYQTIQFLITGHTPLPPIRIGPIQGSDIWLFELFPGSVSSSRLKKGDPGSEVGQGAAVFVISWHHQILPQIRCFERVVGSYSPKQRRFGFPSAGKCL